MTLTLAEGHDLEVQRPCLVAFTWAGVRVAELLGDERLVVAMRAVAACRVEGTEVATAGPS